MTGPDLSVKDRDDGPKQFSTESLDGSIVRHDPPAVRDDASANYALTHDPTATFHPPILHACVAGSI